jgi:hypothetical protein
MGAGQLPMLETADVSGITTSNTHNPKLKTNDMNIPIHDIFQAFLWLFGILWPALGAIICILLAIVAILFICELWRACTEFYYDGSDSYRDRDEE